MIPVNFGVHSYATETPQFSSQRALNVFAEMDEGGARGQVMVRHTEGLKAWITVGSGPIRGIYNSKTFGKLYVVSGADLYEVNAAGTATLLGKTDAGSAPVMWAESTTQVAMLSNASLWTYDGTTLTNVSDPDFLGAGSIAALDGFLIYHKADTRQLNLSEQNDFSSYDSLRFGTAARTTAPIIRVATIGTQIFVFKEELTEIFFNGGLDTFPFQRRNDSLILHGTTAKYSVAQVDSTLYWLGENHTVYRLNGANAERISTAGIETAIREIYAVGGVANAYAMAWTGDGHEFYALTFPEQTFVYDAKTGMWHERASGDLGKWRPLCIEKALGTSTTELFLAGDSCSGAIYELDFATYQDAGSNVAREVIGAPVQNRPNEMNVDRLEITFETGVGPEDNTDPQVILQVSKDGGHTWGHERFASLGKVGERNTRVVWHRLGQGKEFLFKLRASENVKFSIVEAVMHGSPASV